jgi:adenylate kinase family enzyme
VIIGCGGAGKSTLAAELSRRTGIPAVHLDVLFFAPRWRRAPQDEAVRRLRAAIAADSWIVDGNFLSAGDGRFARADAVVFLDRSRATCLRRTLKRLLFERGRARADLPEGCAEGLDIPLLRWIWRYRRDDRPRVLQLLAGLGDDVEIRHLRSDSDVKRYLDSV